MELPPLETGHIPQADILERVHARREEWVGFLERLALVESPSLVPESQAHVLDLMGWSLEELGFRVRRVPGRITGGLLMARGGSGWRSSPRFQLLIGHSDTVWPMGTLNRMPVAFDGSVVRGPGVFDMKAGLTHIVFALRVLKDLSLEPEVEPVVLVNSDEEIGSQESERHILRLSRGASRAFVLEPALDPDGKIKTARKGVGRFVIRVKGKGSHAGLAPQEGASAIQELALVIQRLHAITDFERGISVNVGEIRGGTRSNVVAAAAEAVVDVRVNTMEEGIWVGEQIRAIESVTPGTTLEVEGSVDRPPLERTPGNRLLWQAAQELGEAMGVPLEEGRAGGGSDGNTTSQFTPTLDGLGAVGDGAHALHEFVEVDRTLERCALLAGLLLLPAPPLPRLPTTGVVPGLEEGEGSRTRSS
ncbi:MAG: M20 family peptidase [Gemmatimonadales bacterium]|nr:MAG: M20 family peptidase [Gemmatimonadales bacterium]